MSQFCLSHINSKLKSIAQKYYFILRNKITDKHTDTQVCGHANGMLDSHCHCYYN